MLTLFLKLHAQPWTAAGSSMPDFYLNRHVLESDLILAHSKVAAVSLMEWDVTFWARLSVRRNGRVAEHCEHFTFNKPKWKEKCMKVPDESRDY